MATTQYSIITSADVSSLKTDVSSLRAALYPTSANTNCAGKYTQEGYYIAYDAAASSNSYSSYNSYTLSNNIVYCTLNIGKPRFTVLPIKLLGISLKWTNSDSSTIYTTAYSTGTAIGTGLSNTQLLMQAASSSGELTTSGNVWYELQTQFWAKGGFGWFIPSKDELNTIYTLFKNNSFWTRPSSYVWSSSQNSDSSYYASRQDFNNGGQYSSYKYNYGGALACSGLNSFSY